MSNTITLKGDGIHKEAVAGGAITPGMLVALTSASTNTVIAHSVAGGPAVRAFAIENELEGEDITDAYASGDKVLYTVFQPGSEVYALVAASAPAITKGDYLESDGAGGLRKIILLTDSTGGTANSTLEDIGTLALSTSNTYTDAAVNGAVNTILGKVENDFADLAAKLNALKASAIAVALESVNNSGGSALARIKVEVL